MFGALTEKFQDLFRSLSGKKKLTEDNISDAVRDVRMALLEADVNYGVAKILVKKLKERAIGDEVIKSVTPGQQFIKIVHDELVLLMGGGEPELNLDGNPAVILLCGLQGAGKTTQCVKLAKFLKKQGKCKNPLIAACDLQRPAAIEQLKVLGAQAGIAVYSETGASDPLKVARDALKLAVKEGNDLLIVDTAGRLHVNAELMEQVEKLKEFLKPTEILFVANATTGQDAVNSAAEFNKRLAITGSILTMLDGSARGGAAISIREVTGQPLKFEGIGEKLDDIQLFNPRSMADRILGMGDTINLVKKAEEHINEAEAKKLEEKIRKASFTFDDYLNQMQTLKKMGPLKNLLGMVPGMSQFKDLDMAEGEFGKIEAIILSMTPDERLEKCELIPGRRKRIARGSGSSIEDVNKLVKSFKKMKQFFKNMPNMKKLEKLMGGNSWR